MTSHVGMRAADIRNITMTHGVTINKYSLIQRLLYFDTHFIFFNVVDRKSFLSLQFERQIFRCEKNPAEIKG